MPLGILYNNCIENNIIKIYISYWYRNAQNYYNNNEYTIIQKNSTKISHTNTSFPQKSCFLHTKKSFQNTALHYKY